jgi:hypothetical protein
LLFSKRDRYNSQWKLEYIDTVYNIYDWDKNLTGYFFPNYNLSQKTDGKEKINNGNYDFEEETEIIYKMHKENQEIFGGHLMLPMIKLYLLDNEDGIDLDYAISTLEENIQRAKMWKEWIQNNHGRFDINGSSIYTAREDRNMLSIVLGLNSSITLGEKELVIKLNPLLDKLHEDGMI